MMKTLVKYFQIIDENSIKKSYKICVKPKNKCEFPYLLNTIHLIFKKCILKGLSAQTLIL